MGRTFSEAFFYFLFIYCLWQLSYLRFVEACCLVAVLQLFVLMLLAFLTRPTPLCFCSGPLCFPASCVMYASLHNRRRAAEARMMTGTERFPLIRISRAAFAFLVLDGYG